MTDTAQDMDFLDIRDSSSDGLGTTRGWIAAAYLGGSLGAHFPRWSASCLPPVSDAMKRARDASLACLNLSQSFKRVRWARVLRGVRREQQVVAKVGP
jgi:hypothetical protein